VIRRGVLARWEARLPLTPQTPRLTLGEGDTPLVPAARIAKEIGCSELWLKCEGLNPTGSFKDRGMVVAVAKAIERGSRAVVCASTGNTSASAAAYAAAAGIACRVVVPDGKVALGKLAQAVAHGARIVVLRGNFDAALDAVRALAERAPIALVNSVNPDRIEGQKTSAFEICEALGRVPHGLALPVGNAGNITAYWRGFREWGAERPVLYGFQAEGAAPIVRGAPVEHPETIATAIRIGRPASWQAALAARDESKGLIDMVSDDQILEAYRKLAIEAGVFCEPASAAPIAGLLKLSRAQPARFAGQTLVAVLTGHGLKDPQTALLSAPPLGEPVPNEPRALEEALA
jgi:threonine synthase